MRIAICDDNRFVANYIEECVTDLPFKNIDYDVFNSGEELITHIQTHQTVYNIYFMDIEMPGKNGLETCEYIRSYDKNALIIFITHHKEYVFQVFDVLPFRFLIKPLTQSSLHKVLQEAIQHIRTVKQIFFFHIGKSQYQVPFDEILYFESKLRKVRLVTSQGEYEFYDKISSIRKKLDPTLFMQIHVSYLINMEHIRVLDDSTAILTNNIPLPISKKFRKDAKEKHVAYIEWRSGL